MTNKKTARKNLVGLIFVFCAAHFLLNSSAQAESQRERCQNVAKTAHFFATERDKGTTSKEIGERITYVFKSGELSKTEYTAMYALAGMVYSDYKNQSPDRIRRSFLNDCN